MKRLGFGFSTALCFFALAQILVIVRPTTMPSVTDEHFGVHNQTLSRATTLPPQKDVVDDFPERAEKIIMGFIKDGVKRVMSRMMNDLNNGFKVSPKCLKASMRFISDLTKAKMWALKMLDASSKIPAGLLEGTFTDYGDFDECLEITVPLRNGSEDFRGRFCAVEFAPRLPPTPKNYSLSTMQRAKPLDTLATELRLSETSFHFLHFRLGICIPSSCSIDDIRNVIRRALNHPSNVVRIPKCYVKENVKFQAVHIIVLCISGTLLVLAISAAVVNYYKEGSKSMNSGPLAVLSSFSIIRNSRKLFAVSKGELESLHGIRFLSMAWVVLGHTYVYVSYRTVRRLSNMRLWVNSFEFEAVLNGWLAVEPFFFLSGFLTCYGVLQVLEKTKGRLNFPLYVIHRYLRLTPPMFLAIGLVLLLPLISSGPFWYEIMDESVEPCWNYWWTNLLYISNWYPITKICAIPLWYLCADFQLFLISPLIFLLLYRSSLFGMMALILLTLAGNITVGVITYVLELPPAILISTGNMEQINREIDTIHIATFTHAGPYFIGIATGYLILRKKSSLQFKRWQNLLGWSASITLCVCSVYGVHRWNTGYYYGPLVTSLYAAMHRTTFTLGVAWVAIACITGNGGPVNWILSSKVWTPLGRLTYTIYLLHGPIMWVRVGSVRERLYLSHYNLMYQYFSNLIFVISVSFPFYLLVEAPLNNLQRMIFGRSRSTEAKGEKKTAEKTEEKSPNADSTSHPTADVTSLEAAFTLGNIRSEIPRVITNGFSAK